MLCRRCGMESSTTDVCEWCQRPMLPSGATVTRKQKAEPREGAAPAEPPAPAEAAELRPPAEESPPAPPPEEPTEHQLRPLGEPGQAPAPAPGVPSHGLREEATRTSVDVSQYLGGDQSLFRPLQRPETTGTLSTGGDPLAQRRARMREQRARSDIPENLRLIRCLVSGLIVCVSISLIQFLASLRFGTPSVPVEFYFLSLGRSDSILTAVYFGLASGVLLGGMLGALLVRLQKGPFLGFLIGGFLGGVGLGNGYWGWIMGGLAGILAGRFATVGLRRVVQV